MKRFGYVLVVFLLFSCSAEKSSGVPEQKQAGGENAVSGPAQTNIPAGPYSITIVPANAMRTSTLFINASGFSLLDAKIEWLVNGSPFAFRNSIQFKAADLRKGDKVQAKATIQGREVFSNTIEIRNPPPELMDASIIAEGSASGAALTADVKAADTEGGDISFTYEWTKNGDPAGNTRRVEIPVKRGDKIEVRVTPFIGEEHGRSIVLQREIANFPPRIIEDGDSKYTFDGKVYTYQISAYDPDGDTLSYSLRSSPPGMTINPSTGLVQWTVPPDFKGKVLFTVSVSDGHGGEAVASFGVEITSEKLLKQAP